MIHLAFGTGISTIGTSPLRSEEVAVVLAAPGAPGGSGVCDGLGCCRVSAGEPPRGRLSELPEKLRSNWTISAGSTFLISKNCYTARTPPAIELIDDVTMDIGFRTCRSPAASGGFVDADMVVLSDQAG